MDFNYLPETKEPQITAEELFIRNNYDLYLRACEGSEIEVRRGRAMAVGAGGDGKSNVINRIMGLDFVEDHVITDGKYCSYFMEGRTKIQSVFLQ